jgi:hypothetical protein
MSNDNTSPQLNIPIGYKKDLLDWLFAPLPETDSQDCESIDWIDEMIDWAQKVADDVACPPETSHVYGCDGCYQFFDYLIRINAWGLTDEGARYNREQKHWSWQDLINRGLDFLQPKNFLHEGDRDWHVIGRQSPPDSMPQM